MFWYVDENEIGLVKGVMAYLFAFFIISIRLRFGGILGRSTKMTFEGIGRGLFDSLIYEGCGL